MQLLFLGWYSETIMAYPLFHPARPDHAEAGFPPPLVLTTEEFAQEFGEESAYLEFKEGLSAAVPQSVAAFSNTDGGVILIGVTDRGHVKGVGANGGHEAKVHQFVSDLRDPGRYHLHNLAVADRRVIVVAVAKRVEGFCQTSDGRVLVRRGASNRALFGAALTEFVVARSLRRFESAATDAGLGSADAELLEDLARCWSWSGEGLPERLEENHFMKGGRLTVAGALYLLSEPHDVLGKSYVEIFRYRGEGLDYDRRVEITGPLQKQVGNAASLVLDEIGYDLVLVGIRRHDLPRLPEAVLREAIANAVAHRSYEATGTAVRIDIRPDRVVVTSPGGLPEPVTVENIREQYAARNLLVIKTLRRYGLAEDEGRGVDLMQDEMMSNLLAPPEFEADGSSVRVTLRLTGAATPEERAWVSELKQRGSLAPRDGFLLVHAARGEALSNREARRILGVDRDVARAALQRLRDQGLLIQRGERGGARYLISPDLGPPPGLLLSDEEIDSLVVDMAREGPITNELVRERTGLSRPQALAVLARLVAAGRLDRRGERRGVNYVLPGS